MSAPRPPATARREDASLRLLAAEGARFKVLGQVFPVLRHEILGPLSNGTLAAAMLRQAPEGASAEAVAQRSQRLAGELSSMLEDSVAVIRGLDQWLADQGARTTMERLLEDCRKLLCSHQLLSRQHIDWPRGAAHAELPEYASRYMALAWLLHLLQSLPEDAELELSAPAAGLLRASCRAGGDRREPAVGREDVELLAAASGATIKRDAAGWTLRLPLCR